MDWIDLDYDRYQWSALVNMVMNLWVPWNGKSLSICATGGFSRRAQLLGVSYVHLVGVDFTTFVVSEVL
jgi:hypothetical protein